MRYMVLNKRRAPSLFTDFDRFFTDRVFDSFFETSNHQLLSDNVHETEDGIFLSVDLPGVKQNEISVEVNHDSVSIRAERSDGRIRTYNKRFSLPDSVDSESVEAHYENGVLTLLLPKAAAARPRKLEIQSGKDGFFQRLLGKRDEKSVDVKAS